MELQKLADMADKIMDVAPPTVSAIASGGSSEVSELRQEVGRRLAELVASLTTRYSRPCSRNRSRSRPNRPQSPAPSSSYSAAEDSLYWYHRKFGEKAKKCQSPCNWENSLAGQ